MSNESNFSVVVFQQDQELIDFKIHQESQEIWATIKEIAALYGVDKDTIAYHINNIYRDEELSEASTTEDFQVVQNEGNRAVKRILTHYNLDIIISVGYRVNAKKAIAFRQWATHTLKTYLEQGYLINEKALRDSPEKVNELAAKVRAIRSGEKQVYTKVRDCFKISASDYDPSSKEVRMFYMLLQDKFHHAITGMTSSKLILDRANHLEENMGLYNMAGTFPKPKEIEVGKNYLRPEELYRLHLLSEQFLLYAESTALQGKQMTMASLHKQLDRVLTLNDYDVFPGYTDYIKEEALDHARQEFERYKKKKIIEDNGYTYDEDMAASGEFDFLFEK